jgi:multidrug efflux pump subunit AcrA (membrane-fusion protein)
VVLLAVLCLPVRLTVLAPGELVPANPATIRAPLDGVIADFAVRPNQMVAAGAPLFSFDQAPIDSRLSVAREALGTAEAPAPITGTTTHRAATAAHSKEDS